MHFGPTCILAVFKVVRLELPDGRPPVLLLADGTLDRTQLLLVHEDILDPAVAREGVVGEEDLGRPRRCHGEKAMGDARKTVAAQIPK